MTGIALQDAGIKLNGLVDLLTLTIEIENQLNREKKDELSNRA